MKWFRRKRTWQRTVTSAARQPAVKAGVVAVASAVGLSAASSAVTAWREKHES